MCLVSLRAYFLQRSLTNVCIHVRMDLIQLLNLSAGEKVGDYIFVTFLKYKFQNFVFLHIPKTVFKGILANKCSENFNKILEKLM